MSASAAPCPGPHRPLRYRLAGAGLPVAPRCRFAPLARAAQRHADRRRRGSYVVTLWDKTGLEQGGTFGDFVGGYGVEIDATGPWSPSGTQVLAEIPELFGPGLTGQMSYYETAAGAKVFAAGALDFGGSATFWPVSRMLENLWARLTLP